MTDVPDTYDPDSIEPRWQQQWQESGVYRHEEDEAPDYVIDTPPPYPTGNFHIGNALGWCYMDFVARYRRLQGDDVLFPQGWDCHGLPTEVKVEEERGIQRTDVSRERFRELCVEHTDEQIAAMKETMLELGFSQDWSAEFRTMDPDYWGQTQRSFVEMADEGYVYRDEHPVNWCPRCQTAIADAEVEDHQREGTLYTVRFPGVEGDAVEIATTRPELLSACVGMAVHPDDERYADRVGESFEVPLFGQAVELLADDAVDPEFGTGAVMICTFGDKQDVEWWVEYDLGLRPVFAADGTLTDLAGEYEGLSVEEARERVPEALDAEGLLVAEEPVDQHVGVCWRCETPIEIVSEEQWFVEVRKEEILDTAREAEWIPEHMFDRLAEWTEGMDWDWVVSRQRVFATPIPAWFCEDCGDVHLASVDELPVDPTETDPAVGECPDCGGDAWTGETDVMDTWMDSSISALHVAGWPEEPFEPVQLREQGHDIIRTWAFYSVLRTAALVESVPWERALINGMVMGEDGHKMSKSRGNYVQPEEAVEEGSADAFRQAMALGGQPGSDVTFQWKEVTAATRLLTKLWNVFRFGAEHVDETTPDVQDPAYRDADRWLLSRLSGVVDDVEAAMDEFRFDVAMRRLRSFVWEDLADDYVELVKGRLYNGPPGERNAARHSLYTAISAVVRMLAPFCPHVAEEIYHHLPGTEGSVHEADWPTVEMVDEEAEHAGEIVAEVARAVRAWKSERGMALNEELDRVEVYLDDPPERAIDTYDLSETVSAPALFEGGVPDVELQPVSVEPNHAELGPAFREDAEDVVAALADADPAAVAGMAHRGEVTLDVDGETVTLDPEMVEVVEEYRAASGEAVDVLETEHATVLVVP